MSVSMFQAVYGHLVSDIGDVLSGSDLLSFCYKRAYVFKALYSEMYFFCNIADSMCVLSDSDLLSFWL